MTAKRRKTGTLVIILLLFSLLGFFPGMDDFLVLGEQATHIRIFESPVKRKVTSPARPAAGTPRRTGRQGGEAGCKHGREPFPFLTPRFYQASYLWLAPGSGIQLKHKEVEH
ncbi:MAG: hypothetical protein GXX09_09600 [Syntrophomonadaceae bacterium]|nr:hypothetical protein [Syntrophomonadaceae bacterium]